MTTVSPAEKTGARTAEAADVITGARERVDTLDDRIIGLIQERMAVSAVIQEARISLRWLACERSAPCPSKNMMSTESGTPGEVRI
ncbi:hypothetical protein AB0D38_21115, partial [Streptomyces sp. NPDC048279]